MAALSRRLRDAQMKGAIESFHDAQIARNEALDRLVTLQPELAVIGLKSVAASMQGQILVLDKRSIRWRNPWPSLWKMPDQTPQKSMH